MREILFRGIDEGTNEWVYGFYFEKTADFGGEKRYYIFDDKTITRYNVFPKTVGQYTGLTDKNGAKIFEGDIVRWDGTEISQIRYCEGVYRLCNADGYYGVSVHNHYSYIEAIGNIHDNPELLRTPQNDEVRE